MAKDLEYEDKQLNLEEVIQLRSLPEVVRICYSEPEIRLSLRCRNYTRIEPDTEVMLQKIQKVKYARIKILKYIDKDKSQEEIDAEYVPEHEAYVGDEFLIPSKYRGKVKFIHRPGGWRRYTTVSQVLDDLPSLMNVEEETECLSANELEKKMYISANTTLKLRRKFQNPRDGSTYLECTDNYSNSYAFHQDDRINFTEVEDPKLYNLFELVRCQMLPKVICFERVPPEDAILVDTPLNNAMLSSTEGPIELLGFKDVEVLVSWIRDVDKGEYRTVLIPKAAWNTVLVQKRKLLGMDGKKDYIEKQFDGCNESEFIEKCIYLMSPDLSLVTWLRHPNRFSETQVNEVVDHVPVPFTVSEQSVSSTSPFSSSRHRFWKNFHVGQKIFRKFPTDLSHLRHQNIKIPTRENVYQPEPTKRSVSERQICEAADFSKQLTHVNPTEEKPENQVKIPYVSSPSLSEGVACTYSGEIQSLEETNDEVSDPESSHDYDYIDDDKISDIHQGKSYKIKQAENIEVTPSIISFSAEYSSQTYGSDEYEIIGSSLDFLQYYDDTANNIIADHGNKAEAFSKPSDQTLLSADESYSGNAIGPKEDEDSLRKSTSLGDSDYVVMDIISKPSDLTLLSADESYSGNAIGPKEDEDSLRKSTSLRDSDYVVMDIISDVSCVCLEQHVHHDQSRSSSVVPVEERAEINNSTKNPKLESVATENRARLTKRNLGSADFFQYSVVEVEYCFKHCGLHDFASKCLENRLDGNFFENFNIEILKREPFFLTSFQCLKVKKIIYDGWRPNICKDDD